MLNTPLTLAHWSSLSISTCTAFLPSNRSTIPPNLVLSVNSLRMPLIPLFRSLMKTFNRTGSNTEPHCWPAANWINSTQCHSLGMAIQPALIQLRGHLLPPSPGECHGWQLQRLYWTHHEVCLVSKKSIEGFSMSVLWEPELNIQASLSAQLWILNASLFAEVNFRECLIRILNKTEFLFSFFYSPKFRFHILVANLE